MKVIKTDENFGYSYACNIGASIAKGDLLFFMNPDIICDWNNLYSFVKGAKSNTKWQILSAPQYGFKPRRLQRVFGSFTSLVSYYPIIRVLLRVIAPTKYINPRRDPKEIKEILDVDWVSGSLLLISRENFDKLKGWDEDYWLYYEDQDFCRRARQKGMRIGYYPFARFIHSHASSTRTSFKIKVLTKSETTISLYLYLLKHDSKLSSIILRFLLRFKTNIFYPLFQIAGVLTLNSIRLVEQRRLIHKRLWHHFKRVKKTGNAISDMSTSYATTEDHNFSARSCKR